MDADSHHQNQGPTEVGQLVEGITHTPGHVIGKAETCYRAQRGQAPLGYWPRDRYPGSPLPRPHPIPPRLFTCVDSRTPGKLAVVEVGVGGRCSLVAYLLKLKTYQAICREMNLL